MRIRLTANQVFIVAVVLALLVFFTVFRVYYNQSRQEKESVALVESTQDLLYHTEIMSAIATAVETGSRAYLLTGQQQFIETYARAKSEVAEESTILKKLTANNTFQQQKLDSLLRYVEQRVTVCDSMLNKKEDIDMQAALKIVATGSGKLYLDEIHRLVSQMQQDEQRLLQERKKESADQTRKEQDVLLTIAFLMLTLLIILFWNERKSIQAKERKKAQHELEYLNLQINKANDAIYVVDAYRLIKSWNKGAENLYGFTREDVLNKDPNEVLKTDITTEDFDNALKQISEKEYWTGELRRIRKDGSIIYVRSSTTVIKDDKGIITGFVAVSFDISRQKKLLEQVNHLANMAEQSSEAIFSRDLNKRIISWNKGAETLFGYSKEEVIGKTPWQLGFLKLTEVQASVIEKEIITNGSSKSEEDFVRKDGSSFFGAVTANFIKNESGDIDAFYFIIKDISLRKQLEDQLKRINEELEEKVRARTAEIHKNEKHFRALIENNYDIITLLDPSFKVLYRSPSAARITGWSDEDMMRSDGENKMAIHPNDHEKADNLMKECLENPGKPVYALYRNLHKNGHYIWLEGAVTNLLHDPNVQAILFNFRDVSERVAAEEKIASSEIRFRSLIENSVEGISLLDENSNVIYRSPSASKIIGNNPKNNTISYAYPDNLEYFKNKFAESLSNPGIPIPYTVKYLHPERGSFWAEGTFTNLLHLNGVNAIVANYHDITERIAAEEKLKASEEQFRHSMDNMLEGVQIHDFNWRYIYVNDALVKYSRTSKQDLLGYTLMEKYPGIEQSNLFKILNRCMTDRVAEHFETEFIFADGIKSDFELSVQPVPEGIFILSIDITERKRAEAGIKKLNAELEERVNKRTAELKKANEELEAFSYSVSHDLRAPLRAIIGFSTILEEDYCSKLDDEARRVTNIIKHNTVKMGALIDDLLTFSRMGRHEIITSDVDSEAMVQEIIEGMGSKEATNIKWAIHSLPRVKGDSSMIRQVWINLISNAVKYSRKNAAPQVRIGSFKHGDMLVFFVEDNGVGFDEKYKNKLFKVFQRLHNADEFEGTGIGLAIVEKIVSKHGGHVWAESDLNKGASFYFSLPENGV